MDTQTTFGLSLLALLCVSAISVTGSGETSTFCDVSYMGRLGTGVIRSYNFPFQYRHNLTCTYRIHVGQHAEGDTSKICFSFHRFQLETSTPFCSYDYLKFENTKYCGAGWWQYGDRNENPVSNVYLSTFCWTVKEEYFDIYFNSDNNLNGDGFYATYTIYDQVISTEPQEAALGTAPCTAHEWTCFNRRCIPLSERCDGTDNCGDRSDENYIHARCGEQNILACDFNAQGGLSDGYCGFTHEGWFRTNEAHSPGPHGDHTNTTHGYYVYTDVNQSAAYLLSPEITLPRNKTYCLQFWYYVYGRPAAAELRVYISRDQAYSRPEWTRTSAPEDTWLRGQVTFVTNHPLQAVFAATLDNSFSGVALDDISLLPGACLGNDISCNFESGPCSWSVVHKVEHKYGELSGDLSWRIHNRLIAPVGPFWDKSSNDGGGYYLYVNYTSSSPWQRYPDNRALLVSPPVSAFPHQPRCLRFWYFMAGMDQDCAVLSVKIHDTDGALSEAVWSQHGDVRNAWQEATISLGGVARPYELVVEGIVSEGSRGELAIDALILLDGECSIPSSGACEPGSQYLCHSGRCINATLKCDGVPQCEDGSDEGSKAGCPDPPTPPAGGGEGGSTCPPTHYRCHEDSKCIPAGWKCDSFKDCLDESDENHLAGCYPGSQTPTPGSSPASCRGYACRNGRCVSMDMLCDGKDDCSDNSDEGPHANCSGGVTVAPPAPPVCAAGEFLCAADRGVCVSATRLCDGNDDCSDGSDELTDNCQPPVAALPADSPLPAGLGVGGLVGVVVAVAAVCVIAVLVFFIMRRQRRRSKAPAGRGVPGGSRVPPPPRMDSGISTISRYTEQSTIDRHFRSLGALRDPLTSLPPYTMSSSSSQLAEGENGGFTGTMARGSYRGQHRGELLPPDEPPPPYDAKTSSAPISGAPPPLPAGDRPPISPPIRSSGSRGGIRLGTMALSSSRQRDPRNYINQDAAGCGLNVDVPLAYLSGGETDGESSSVADHIYETLNPPDSRPQTPAGGLGPPTTQHTGLAPQTTHPTASSSTYPTSPSYHGNSAGAYAVSPPLATYTPPAQQATTYRPPPFSHLLTGGQRLPGTTAAGYMPVSTTHNSPSFHGDAAVTTSSSYRPSPSDQRLMATSPPGSRPPAPIGVTSPPPASSSGVSSFQPGGGRPRNNAMLRGNSAAPPPPTRFQYPRSAGPASRYGHQPPPARPRLGTAAAATSSPQYRGGALPGATGGVPGYNRQSSRPHGWSPPTTASHYPGSNGAGATSASKVAAAPPGGSSRSRGPMFSGATPAAPTAYQPRDAAVGPRASPAERGCRTPDSQSHLLPASNNSSFDGGLSGGGGGELHPRQDSNVSGQSVVFSNLDGDALLPTCV